MLTETTTVHSWVTPSEPLQIGIKHVSNQYISAGHDGVYVPAINNYKIFGDIYYYKYFRNVIPWGRNTDKKLADWKIHPASLNTQFVVFYSEIKTKYVFGFELSDEVEAAVYDTLNGVLYCNSTVKHSGAMSIGQFAIFPGTKQLTQHNFSVLGNVITYQTFYPFREKLISPFSMSSEYIWLDEFLEKHSQYELTLPFTSEVRQQAPVTTITLLPVRCMIELNRTYYTVDSNTYTLQPYTPSGSDLTLNELVQNGVGLDLVNSVPAEQWQALVHSDDISNFVYILSPGYLIPVMIDTNKLLAHYETNKYIWTIQRHNSVVQIVGDI